MSGKETWKTEQHNTRKQQSHVKAVIVIILYIKYLNQCISPAGIMVASTLINYNILAVAHATADKGCPIWAKSRGRRRGMVLGSSRLAFATIFYGWDWTCESSKIL